MLSGGQQGFPAVGGGDHLEAVTFQAPHQHIAAELVVFG
jgi:hypothetical protein